MKVTLYTTHCSRCSVLEGKLNSIGLEYNLIDDLGIMRSKKIMSVPQLEVNGQLMDFTQAIAWVNERIGDTY